MRILTAVIFLWVSALNAQRTSIRILPIELPNRPASLSHAISFSSQLTTIHHNVLRALPCWQKFSRDTQLKEWAS
jgi:hypothetical protein